MKIKISRKDFINDILDDMEYACSYWARGVRKGDTWDIWDMEIPDETYVVDAEVIEKGIEAAKSFEYKLNEDLKKDIFMADNNNESVYLDAVTVDVIVQAGIFGETVYG